MISLHTAPLQTVASQKTYVQENVLRSLGWRGALKCAALPSESSCDKVFNLRKWNIHFSKHYTDDCDCLLPPLTSTTSNALFPGDAALKPYSNCRKSSSGMTERDHDRTGLKMERDYDRRGVKKESTNNDDDRFEEPQSKSVSLLELLEKEGAISDKAENALFSPTLTTIIVDDGKPIEAMTEDELVTVFNSSNNKYGADNLSTAQVCIFDHRKMSRLFLSFISALPFFLAIKQDPYSTPPPLQNILSRL